MQSSPFIASPLIPLLLLSLSSERYQPKTKEAFRDEYDYIIVGAGSAGSVVANRLSENSCVSVLLLTEGNPPSLLTEVPGIAAYIYNPDTSTTYNTTSQKYAADGISGRKIPLYVGNGPGGTSNINAMLYVRGNHKDYDRWAAQGATGWSWDDVFPYFKKLEDNRNAEIVSNGYHNVGGPMTATKPPYVSELNRVLNETFFDLGYPIIDSNGPRQTGVYEYQATIRDGKRCSTAKAYLVPAENRTNLDIVTGAFVKKITIVDGRATGVELDYKNEHFEVSACREVILSGGSILSPKLLMLSGIGPRKHLEIHGITVIADLPVGRNLQDHMFAYNIYTAEKPDTPFQLKITDPVNILEYISNQTGPLADPASVTKIAFLRRNFVNETDDFPEFQLIFSEPKTAESSAGSGSENSSSDSIPIEGRTVYKCIASQLHPRSRGTVKLKSSNPYDKPVINPHYFKNRKDLDAIVEGLKECDKIYTSRIMKERLGMKPYTAIHSTCSKYEGNIDRFYRCIARTLSASFYHLVGTAKMGQPKDSTTVVDPELRVKGVQDLRVVDASVMPLVTSGNTNVPTMMVAEKASDIIKKTIQCN